ncbi:dicarboxylate/amino acid:cation symporter [Candidatus Marinamargulisbacteria bacterium SCGC AAA071-K20]|nr:dicarboxylate/amino acid:cation symporter [Candidatus Marinamargulisbacteria bacterium SCGC AAA071-K20]
MYFKFKLHFQIFLGIVLGILAGILFRENVIYLAPIGDIFIRMLKMVIIPIIFASLIVGVMNLGSIQNLGRLGIKTFIYYVVTSISSVTIGLILVNIIKPGVGSTLSLTNSSVNLDVAATQFSFLQVFMEIVPENILNSMAQEKMLGVIFFSIVFGCAMLSIERKSASLHNMISALNNVVLKITDWIMLLAPLGVFALTAVIVGKTGFSAFKPLAFYMFTVVLALSVHVFFVLIMGLVFIGKYSPIKFLKNMFPSLATAFSTDSSVATLPVTMECLEKNVGVSKKVVGFVVPLGATINMDGTALYEAVAAMFIAQVYGIDLSITQQFVIMLTATLASIGAAGIPSAGLVTMVIVLRAVNLPLEGIGLLLAVDRILDMCRTTVNVFGDACGAVIIARLEGESKFS